MVRPVESGGGLGPRQKHPASPGAIRAHASALTHESGKAIDQRAITDHAFRPAADNWDGIAAPELRSAPGPVRSRAHDLSSRLAWAAVPLNYWAHQVETFNAEVDKIEAALSSAAGANGHYGAKGAKGEPPTDDQVNTAKTNAMTDADSKWQNAYDTYIVKGANASAGMFQQGPTDANVALAKSVGALPAGPGIFTVYTAEWHQHEMRVKAQQAAALAKKINDPDYVPNPADLARLSELLKNQADPTFATAFLNELGPTGLLQLTINAADFQADIGHAGGHNYPAPDANLAALMASVQSGLGAILATGTKKVGAPNQVSADWLGGLLAAGGQPMESTIKNGPSYGHDGIDLYGYQALGVLLSTKTPGAHFSSLVLSGVGDGMIQFEQDHGGSKVWTDMSMPNGRGEGYRLNWINGYDLGDQAGSDPVTGLMAALKNDDPDVARQWFTHQLDCDGPGPGPAHGVHLSLVKYLLTDRDWPPDQLRGGEDWAWNVDHRHYVSNGVTLLGEALDNAVTHGTPDQDSRDLSESVVYELTHADKVTGAGSKTFSHVDIVPPSMRASIAHIVAYNMNGVYDSLSGGHGSLDPKTGDEDDYTPGVQRYVPSFEQHDIALILADLGKDQNAYDTVETSALTYATLGYDHVLNGNLDPHGNTGVAQVNAGLAGVNASLDFGAATAHHTHLDQQAADHNNRVDNVQALADYVAQKAISKLPAGGDLASIAYGKISDLVASDFRHDYTGKANYDAGTIETKGGQLAQSTYTAAVYRAAIEHDGHLPAHDSPQIPPELREGNKSNGTPIPMNQWTPAQQEIWGHQLHGQLSAQGDQRVTIGQAYMTAFASAKNTLEIWAPGQ